MFARCVFDLYCFLHEFCNNHYLTIAFSRADFNFKQTGQFCFFVMSLSRPSFNWIYNNNEVFITHKENSLQFLRQCSDVNGVRYSNVNVHGRLFAYSYSPSNNQTTHIRKDNNYTILTQFVVWYTTNYFWKDNKKILFRRIEAFA